MFLGIVSLNPFAFIFNFMQVLFNHTGKKQQNCSLLWYVLKFCILCFWIEYLITLIWVLILELRINLMEITGAVYCSVHLQVFFLTLNVGYFTFGQRIYSLNIPNIIQQKVVKFISEEIYSRQIFLTFSYHNEDM